MQSKKDLVRLQAEQSLEKQIRLLQPGRVLGSIHVEIIDWWQRPERKSHQLVLLPRDHQKSALTAFRVVHAVTVNPTVRIIYLSSTANLAIKQLGFIKQLMTSPRYQSYWPEMINSEETKRAKWTETEISVDHPKRREEAIRDPTIFCAGITTNITGMHCDILVLDDLVVYDNSSTEDAREKLEQQFSLLSSVESAQAEQWVAGTRYHPKDLYNKMLTTMVDQWDNDGNLVDGESLYEIFGGDDFKKQWVEDAGDGSGEYLWPLQYRSDGKPYGFNRAIWARKYAQYADKMQFRAQYYNDPNSIETATISRDLFQYYDRKFLVRQDGNWFYKNKKLNITAAVDFAFSLAKRADYTCIVVVGLDADNNYYVLDIDRFKTDKISDYFDHILSLHQKWDIREITAEVTVAQDVIVKSIKNDYIRKHGLALSIKDYRPGRAEGLKEERIEAILQPKYNNRQVWHYQGGNCQTLEDELILRRPPHDDVKDALASAINACVIPSLSRRSTFRPKVVGHSRFGGVS